MEFRKGGEGVQYGDVGVDQKIGYIFGGLVF